MRLYNSMTQGKEEFVPATPGKVALYVCGITSYDYCHIGHARSAAVFDVLVRYLRYKGLDVTFVRNFTDVDDKIIKRANQEGKSSELIAETYIQAFYEDMDALKIIRADHEPKATEYIGKMIELAQLLISKGHAYATLSGDVYFKVRSFEGYGKLSKRDIEELESGARVEPGEEKMDPLDFALWKAAKPGEPSWTSPWGQGRPGWHLECSAMSESLLGLPLDIHGGGQDLVFPHHENEIAQTEAAYGKTLARVWMHNGFVNINAEKMSKSLNNFITIRDIFKSYLPEVLRFFLLSTQYRSPLDYSTHALDESEKGIRRVYQLLARIQEAKQQSKWSAAGLPDEVAKELEACAKGFDDAMDDDMNTAGAMGHIFNLVRLVGRVLDDKNMRKSQGCKDLLARCDTLFEGYAQVLGVFDTPADQFLLNLRDSRAARLGISAAQVEALLALRAQARIEKDFAASDAIRDQLTALQVVVKDTPSGQTWDVA